MGTAPGGCLPPPSADQSECARATLCGASQRNDIRGTLRYDLLKAESRYETAQLLGGARQLLSLRGHFIDLHAHFFGRSADFFSRCALFLRDRRDRLDGLGYLAALRAHLLGGSRVFFDNGADRSHRVSDPPGAGGQLL